MSLLILEQVSLTTIQYLEYMMGKSGRTVYSCEVITEGNIGKNEREKDGKDVGQDIIIRVAGNGFLYNMVRIIAGTLMEVGRGQIDANDIPAIIDAKDRSKAGPTAPACGLTLVKYEFAPGSLAN